MLSEFFKWNSEKTKLEILSYSKKRPPTLVIDWEQMSGRDSWDSKAKCKWDGRRRDCHKNIALLVKGLRPEHHRLEIQNKTLMKRIDIQLLPGNMPALKVKGRSTTEEPFVFSLQKVSGRSEAPKVESCHLVIMSSDGELDFYRQLNANCTDFRPHLIRGKVYYSYAIKNEDFSTATAVGPRIILDENFEEINRIENLEVSNFNLLSEDHWLGFYLSFEKTPRGTVFLNRSLVEKQNDKIIFRWSLLDYIRQFKTEIFPSAEIFFQGTRRAVDLVHFDSFQQIEDQGFLLNLGDSGVSYLDRVSGKIKWVLGGFQDEFSVHDDLISHTQHMPFWDPTKSEVLMFSNRRTDSYHFPESRALRYQLNIPDRKITDLKVLAVKNFISIDMGSVQESKNGSITVGFGSRENGDSDAAEIFGDQYKMEISVQGSDWRAYRVYRHPY